MTTRKCSTCGVEKPLDAVNFHPNKMYREGFTRQCKECRSIKIKQWQEAHPESLAKSHAKYVRTEKGREMHARARVRHREKRTFDSKKWHEANRHRDRDYALRKRYGITLAQYEQMFAEQNGVCAICKQPETTTRGRGKDPNAPKVMAVDHCHKTNGVRKLLCYKCNVMLGSARESAEILQAAIEYLKSCS